MRLFHWLCGAEIPPACDLRLCGWTLAGGCSVLESGSAVALAHVAGMDRHAWTRLRHDFPRPRHDRVMLLGVGDSGERARLLGLGFGDVLDHAPALGEVEARAARIAARADMLPGRREIGRLRLDLLARDGFVAGRKLALHPREFALLWRLADAPGLAVAKRVLLAEVWRMGYVPDTNSLAVHVFRLRAKLAGAGLKDLVQTVPEGGYRLVPPDDAPPPPAVPLLTGDSRMNDLIVAEADSGVAIGDFRP